MTSTAPTPRLEQHLQAPQPTRWTIALRTNLPWQLWRFLWINLKMIRVIAKSHESHVTDRKVQSLPPSSATESEAPNPSQR